MLNLRDLKSFVTVIDSGSFSKAAKKLALSQPTVSAHINSLEEKLALQLVVRSTKSSTTTEAGSLLYDHAKRILDLLDEAETDLRAYSAKNDNTLRIAVSTIPALYFLPESLPQLQKVFPDLSYDIIETDSTGAAAAVYEHRADLAIVGTKLEYEGLLFTKIAEESLLLIAPPLEPYLSSVSKVNRHDLQSWPFIRREEGSGTWLESYNFFNSYNINPEALNTVAMVNGTSMALQSVKSGLGYTLLSEQAAKPYIERGDVIDLESNSSDLKRYFWLVTPDNRPSTPALRFFTALVKKRNTGTS
ncbi:MAG: selenium metabolism-associated LysR family transcriptional regulator [Eubacteriales bacterium]|nr:selenium metabolism-associated LysR family transcriptional regulator [Eubacteriales bacterium]MDD4323718.1 selenium metabolism-associated LysR family transcriptional regulator [Eubacteriales bacterium]MDD4540667.1 selenium metabolism-associated LysR family transcriptional regulator [Eubacteriales bacterium]